MAHLRKWWDGGGGVGEENVEGGLQIGGCRLVVINSNAWVVWLGRGGDGARPTSMVVVLGGGDNMDRNDINSGGTRHAGGIWWQRMTRLGEMTSGV